MWVALVDNPGFPRGEVPTPKGCRPTIGPFFSEKLMKMKKFWVRGRKELRSSNEHILENMKCYM